MDGSGFDARKETNASGVDGNRAYRLLVNDICGTDGSELHS